MEVSRDNINQLITKTLKMEQNQQVVQDPRLIKKEREEEIDWTRLCMETQPMPESEEEEENMENIETEEKSQDISPPKDSILKRHRTKYTATRIKYSPTRNLETFYRISVILVLTKVIFTMKTLSLMRIFLLLKI